VAFPLLPHPRPSLPAGGGGIAAATRVREPRRTPESTQDRPETLSKTPAAFHWCPMVVACTPSVVACTPTVVACTPTVVACTPTVVACTRSVVACSRVADERRPAEAVCARLAFLFIRTAVAQCCFDGNPFSLFVRLSTLSTPCRPAAGYARIRFKSIAAAILFKAFLVGLTGSIIAAPGGNIVETSLALPPGRDVDPRASADLAQDTPDIGIDG
jgi:hypothetical protein